MLEEMVEYQTEEMNVIKLENELTKSPSREKAIKLREVLKNQQSELVGLENSAKKINDSFNESISTYEDYLKKLDKLEKDVENADPEKSDLYEKTYKEFVQIAESLEKNIAKISSEVKKINEKYEETIKKSKSLREEFNKHYAKYTSLKAESDPKIQKSKDIMASLEKKINNKILAVYKQKRDSHIFPVFVVLINNKCGGCRMDISASKLEQMKSNELGIIECENCGRYIYQN